MRTGGGCRTVDREVSRFPRKERLHMPGSLTTPGRPALAMTRSDVLPSTICTVSAPRIRLFRGSMAGLCAPLSTLRRDPRGPLRMIGADVDRYSFIARDLLLAGLPALRISGPLLPSKATCRMVAFEPVAAIAVIRRTKRYGISRRD